jgi:hypothetical protein
LILTVIDSLAKATSARKKRAVNDGKKKRLNFMIQTDKNDARLAREKRYTKGRNHRFK